MKTEGRRLTNLTNAHVQRSKLRSISKQRFRGTSEHTSSAPGMSVVIIFCLAVHELTSARDTVSSVGIVREKILPYTADGLAHVCYFRHALALDERRVKFLPEYAHGGVTTVPEMAGAEKNTPPEGIATEDTSPPSPSESVHTRNPPSSVSVPTIYPPSSSESVPTIYPSSFESLKEAATPAPHTKEVWFAGTHSDM